MAKNPRKDWGLPEFPSNPPRKDVRDSKEGGCLAVALVPVALLLALLTLVVWN